MLVVAAALAAPVSGDGRYRLLVLAGLACSLAGDVFLMLPRDRFVAGLASFLAAHLAYLGAFVLDGGPRLTGWALLPFVLVAGALLARLFPAAQLVILSTYRAAQWLIATSV